ncbi:unnamed protein product [Spirodela intermedia]|uniref:Uncharacterized protein n=1 Tax=Spirodela intermedia TaxID=51605 RepID=A0A7I8IN12_SPIIN|nr:unnamed protein product [Spirodela intermedia]CAA6659179.1 unnamed protein product [Spirodela intermedia]
MASYQPLSPSLRSSALVEKKKLGPEASPHLSHGGHPAGATASPPEKFAGSLEVHVYRARDIHNICIYHKQDVYAKVCLTSDPASSVSSKIINGGDRIHCTADTSLKCEIWMLSRVKNYLEDQLLGFALVPLSEIVGSGALAGEFPLSSTDLFHSPAGFPIATPPPPLPAVIAESALPDSGDGDSIPCEYEKIEFPDLEIVDENKRMVSEIFGISCDKIESESSVTPDSDAGIRLMEIFLSESYASGGAAKTGDYPSCSTSINGSRSLSESSVTAGSPNREDKIAEVESSAGPPAAAAIAPPMIRIEIAPEPSVVQQEIVDMYMKSMQQFTESLANMKLPMDLDSNAAAAAAVGEEKANVAGAEEKSRAPKEAASRVFYGSGAFF